MLFALTLAESFFFHVIVPFVIGTLAFKRLLGKWDKDGRVNESVKRGVISMIGRWLR